MGNVQAGSQKIGGQVQSLLDQSRTRKVSPSNKSSTKSTSLETTGLQRAVKLLSSDLGMRDLESGVANLIATADREYPGQEGEEAAARELCSLLKASKKLPANCKQWGPIVLHQLLDENESGRKALRLASMLGHFPQQEQSPAIADMITRDYMRAVAEFPAYAVDAGVFSILMGDCKRRPTMAQLVEACKTYSWRYRALKDHMKAIMKKWGEI